jgi:lipopolysaccharide export system permease protein
VLAGRRAQGFRRQPGNAISGAMRIFPILSAYIGRQFLVAFLGGLLVIMALILLFDVIELLRRAAANPEVEASTLIVMALLKLPQMINLVLPFAVMIGAMVAFWRLTRSHELIIARASGVSVWQFLGPVMALVFVVGVLNVTAFNPLAAKLYTQYERMQDVLLMRKTNPLVLSKEGLWLREAQEAEHVVLHADAVRQEGLELHMREISIFVFDGPDRFLERINARTGRLVDNVFDLQKVWMMQPGRASEYFDELKLPTTLTISKIQSNFSSPETVSFWELPEFIRFFEGAGFSAARHRLHLQSMIASPFLLCAMVLLAAVFTLQPNQRSGGLLTRVASGVIAGFLLYFFSKLVYALGLGQTLPLFLSAWSPAIVASLVGIGSLLHLEDG